jgi:hypothetical protein
MSGQYDQIERHAHDVDADAHHLQQGELNRSVGITQVGEGYRSEGVDGHARAHDHQILGMVGIADGRGHGMEKEREQHHEEQ